MELGQAVKMFRCQIDPMIGPKPRNAFMVSEIGEARLALPIGVWVRVQQTGRVHLVPFANIQSIELEPEEKKPKKEKSGAV